MLMPPGLEGFERWCELSGGMRARVLMATPGHVRVEFEKGSTRYQMMIQSDGEEVSFVPHYHYHTGGLLNIEWLAGILKWLVENPATGLWASRTEAEKGLPSPASEP